MSDTRQSARERYFTDSIYKNIVDTMTHMLNTAQLTPSEMREAAILASINYENLRIRSFHITMTPELHATLESLNSMVSDTIESKT